MKGMVQTSMTNIRLNVSEFGAIVLIEALNGYIKTETEVVRVQVATRLRDNLSKKLENDETVPP